MQSVSAHLCSKRMQAHEGDPKHCQTVTMLPGQLLCLQQLLTLHLAVFLRPTLATGAVHTRVVLALRMGNAATLWNSNHTWRSVSCQTPFWSAEPTATSARYGKGLAGSSLWAKSPTSAVCIAQGSSGQTSVIKSHVVQYKLFRLRSPLPHLQAAACDFCKDHIRTRCPTISRELNDP